MLAVLILRVDVVYQGFEFAGRLVAKFLDFTNEGSAFVFGPLASRETVEKGFGPGNGFIFVVQALPTVIFVSAVFTVLYHLRVLQAGRLGVRQGDGARVRHAG